MQFDDPQEPWITRGILISLASLFDLCKITEVKFIGDGKYGKPKYSVPGTNAVATYDNSGECQYVADGELFFSCIQDIREADIELSKSIRLLRDFDKKLSVTNLIQQFVYPRPEIASAISDKGIKNAIHDFTLDFQELVELAELLKVSFRNRKSHRKLRDDHDTAFFTYHHALMSRFLQLVDKCLGFTQSRGWLTNGPSVDEQGAPLPMIQNHIEEFRSLTEDVFGKLGDPLHISNSGPDASLPSDLATQQPEAENENTTSSLISKADIYDIADAIREAHDESGSYFAWLEERMASLITDTAEDLKNSLFEPWRDKNIEDVLELIARQALKSNPSHGDPSAPPSGDTKRRSEKKSRQAQGVRSESRASTFLQPATAGHTTQKILSELRDLCKEIRNRLNEINPRFEFYHCVLQSPIVAPAIQLGVCSYDQLKQTDQFISRIINNNNSFMLVEQEQMYRQRIDQILSQNRPL